MPNDPETLDLPQGVKSVDIKEQKIFDGLRFPLILSPTDAYVDKDALFWNGWVEKNLKVIEAILLKYGAILFRGFPLDTPKDFDEFAKAYGYDPFLNVNGSGVRYNVVGNVFTASATPPEYVIPLHPEMAHIRDYPYVLFFYCEIPAKEGGNTPIALSNIVYRKMAERDPDFVGRLEKEGLRYSRIAPDGNDGKNTYGRSWQSTCFTSDKVEAEKSIKDYGFDFKWLDDGAMKVTTETLPAIRIDKRNGKSIWFNSLFSYAVMGGYPDDPNRLSVNFPNGDAISDEMIDVIAQVMDETKVSFKWHSRDVIMMDNRAVMHSKEAYVAPPRRILVSYFKDEEGPIWSNP